MHVSFGVNFSKEWIFEVFDETNSLTRRLHFRTQFFFHVWKLLVGENRYFDGIAFFARLEVKISNFIVA